MPKHGSDDWDRIEKAALIKAAGLTANSLSPVSLEQIASTLAVRRARIVPLLCTAGLRKDEEGFEIWINTEAPGMRANIPRTMEFLNADMPALPPPVRFSFAHELAHLILMLCSGNQKAPLSNVRRLERACNILAGALLIPARAFTSEVIEGIFHTNTIRELSNKWQISSLALIFRLPDRDLAGIWRDSDGIIVLARKESKNHTILASFVTGPQATARFGPVLQSSRNEIFLHELRLGEVFDAAITAGAAFSREEYPVPVGLGRVLPCRIEAETSVANSEFLIAIQKLRQPEIKPSAGKQLDGKQAGQS